MVTASEAADEYRSVLMDLTRNDKTQINLLTILAEDYASFSSDIVKVIEDSLNTCTVPLKIVMLYVIDSIVKNIPTSGGYRELFSKKIVEMIVHVFKESDEKTRASIYRLRLTWTDIFPKSKLYMIDTRINLIDKAWPILNPHLQPKPAQQQGHVVHVNPRFLNGKAVAKPSQQPPAAAAEPTKVKKEPVCAEDVSSTTPDPSSSGSTTLVVTIQNDKKSPEKAIKKETPEELSTKEAKNGSKAEKVKKEDKTKEKPAKKESSEQAKLVKERRKSREAKENSTERRKRPTEPAPLVKKLKQDMGRIPKKSQQQQQQMEMQKPESLLSLRIEPPEFPASTHQPKKQQLPPPHHHQPKPHQQQPVAPPPKRPRQSHTPPMQQQHHGFFHQKMIPEPTAALGAHAFGHNVVAASSHSGATPPKHSADQTVIMDTSAMHHTHSFQQQFATPVSQPMLIPMNTLNMQQTSSSFMDTPIQMTPQFPVVQHNIQNVTPRLPGVPENNRIFVDGKAYEVFFLDEVAVIERNGLPHRVSFAGPPRDVIIDGIAHRMAFGEQKQVLIDGEVHVLRFGAPSREIYMGSYPFKGAFGGPPIIATINNIRHEIRLCGPPPEVRIDPEPSYELMRYMPAIRQQQPQQPSPKLEAPKKESLDVLSLLQRLQRSGVLAQAQANEADRQRRVALEAKGAAIGRSNSPPIPCSHRLDHIERRDHPMAGLEQFSTRSLSIRYDSVIDTIHRQRKCCQHCGISFNELYGEAYQRHVDWHLQDTLRMKDPRHKYNRSQPWYMLEDWFNYSETETVNRTQTTDAEKQVGDDAGKANSPTGQQADGGNQDAPSDSIDTKECKVCREQFDEYWDEEEDVWRLRDCMVLDGKAFHTYCRDDAMAGGADSSIQMDDQ